MSNDFVLNAVLRTDKGKGASRRLRRTEMVPGIIYGGSDEPVSVSIKKNELTKCLESEAFFSHVIELQLDGSSIDAIVKDMQRHPSIDQVLHIDFLRASKDSIIKVRVPLHFLGEELAPGVKSGGSFSHNVTEVEVACLPADLPDFMELDVSMLDQGDTLHLSDLKLPEGIVVVELTHGEAHDQAVVSLNAPKGMAVDEDEQEPSQDEGDSEEA